MGKRHLHEANRLSWNIATRAHNSHKVDQAGFLRSGGSTLFPEEIEHLGAVAGTRIAHLQCNAGQDSLSLAALGAEVVGVDISDEAIDFARRLAQDSGINAEFVRADVYDWLDEASADGDSFDIVFCSYGAVCWISDLRAWARGIAGILAPGGRFVTVEFHPFAMVFDEHYGHAYPYFADGDVLTWDDGVADYVARSGAALAPSGFAEGVRDFANPHPVHEFQWSLSDITGSLTGAGLTLDRFVEYPYSNGARLFDDMVEGEGRRFHTPDTHPSLPLMYALSARR